MWWHRTFRRPPRRHGPSGGRWHTLYVVAASGNPVDHRGRRGAPWTLLRRGTSVVSGKARGEVGGRHGLLSGHGPAPPPPPRLTGPSGPARLTGTDRETIDGQRNPRLLRQRLQA